MTLRFPNNRLAQFNLSYFGNPANSFVVVGTDGIPQMNPSYTFGAGLRQTVIVGDKKDENTFKHTDQFGGEMKYFSECILKNERPEPDREEGFADVRVLQGILTALHSGQSVTLPPFHRYRRIDIERQRMTLSAVFTPELVHASNPGRGEEKGPKN